jgi:hypothetical protein
MCAQFISINSQRKQQKQSEEVLIRGFVQAIADEVTSVWNRYNVEIGPPLRLTKPHAGCRQEIQPQFLIYSPFGRHVSSTLLIRALISFASSSVRGFSIQGSLLLAIRFAGSAFRYGFISQEF